MVVQKQRSKQKIVGIVLLERKRRSRPSSRRVDFADLDHSNCAWFAIRACVQPPVSSSRSSLSTTIFLGINHFLVANN
jgi:hypothetical protein